jgi:hypothetical protein
MMEEHKFDRYQSLMADPETQQQFAEWIMDRDLQQLENDGPSLTEIWNIAYQIDCSPYVERRGQFDYLPWFVAWRLTVQHLGHFGLRSEE